MKKQLGKRLYKYQKQIQQLNQIITQLYFITQLNKHMFYIVKYINQLILKISYNTIFNTSFNFKQLNCLYSFNYNIKIQVEMKNNLINLEKNLKKNYSKSTIASKKYAKITPQLRQKLAYMIIQQNYTIKNASNLLKINYSSAKAIFSHYRNSNKITILATQQCGYVQTTIRNSNLKVIYTIGGRYQGQINTIKPILV